MAEMPRDKARSVRDPLGDLAEQAQRRDRLKREQAEDAAALKRSARLADYRLPFDRRSADFDFTRRLEPTVGIRGKTYREVDNGVANVLVPVDDPLVTPAVLADRRRAVERASFAARSPIGSVLDVVGMFAGASPKTRNGLLIAGGTLDAAMLGAAPRGAQSPVRHRPPPNHPSPPPLNQPKIMLRELNASGQAMGAKAWVTSDMLGPGRRPDRRIKPVGWSGNGRTHNEARGHLAAGRFSGPHDDPRNFATLTQNPTNNSYMKTFENDVARRALTGEVVEYYVMPFYSNGASAPAGVTLSTYGSRQGPKGKIISNPAGRRK